MDEFEFDQAKFQKLEECKVEDEPDTEVNTDDAISIAYDLSEYGDAMVERLVTPGPNKKKTIGIGELKQKLHEILEVNENEAEEEPLSGSQLSQDKKSGRGITEAQLAAYQRLLDKLENDQADKKTSADDDASTTLMTAASTFTKAGQSFYSVRKIKDYLQKKAKEAKKVEVEKNRIEEQEAVKKMIEEDKKTKNKLCPLFNPLLALKPINDSKPL